MTNKLGGRGEKCRMWIVAESGQFVGVGGWIVVGCGWWLRPGSGDYGQVVQSVEQRTEKPCVGGSEDVNYHLMGCRNYRDHRI